MSSDKSSGKSGVKADSPAPAAKDSPAPAAKDSPAPAAKDSPAPAAKDSPAPAAKDSPAPAAKDSPAPAAKDSPAPAAKDSPAPAAKDSPAPAAKDSPAPAAKDSPAPAAKDSPAPAAKDHGGAGGGPNKVAGSSPPPAKITGELETAKAEAEASAERLRVAQAAADEILEEEYRKTAESLKRDKPHDSFTDYRTADIIFRRDLGEPEFWLDKGERTPVRLVLSDEEAREISRRVEIPADQTPAYDPQYILSKEYGGTSSYEVGISAIIGDALEEVEALRKAGAAEDAIRRAELDVEKLGYLYQNYHIGMNVFRTAKGGRDRAKK